MGDGGLVCGWELCGEEIWGKNCGGPGPDVRGGSCFRGASGGRLAVMTQTQGSSIARVAPAGDIGAGSGVILHAALHWVYVLACLFAIGPVVLRVVARVHDAHGGHAASLLTDGAAGFVALGTVLVACLIVGVIGARFFTLGVGAIGAGMVAAWGAWGCAPSTRSSGPPATPRSSSRWRLKG